MNCITRPMSPATKMKLKGVVPGRSNFSTSWPDTELLLHREIRMLGAHEYVLQIDMDESQFKIDGTPRANGRANSAAIAIGFKTNKGPLEFACARYYRWQDNVLAVAKGLEALRMIDRYGITQAAQQYEGFRTIGSGIAMPEHQMTVEEAAAFIASHAGDDNWLHEVQEDPTFALVLFKDAVKLHHPDVGGDAATFDKLVKARELLEAL